MSLQRTESSAYPVGFQNKFNITKVAQSLVWTWVELSSIYVLVSGISV